MNARVKTRHTVAWDAECLGGPWDGQRKPVRLDRHGEPQRLTLQPRKTTGLYHLTLDWRTGRAAWAWAP